MIRKDSVPVTLPSFFHRRFLRLTAAPVIGATAAVIALLAQTAASTPTALAHTAMASPTRASTAPAGVVSRGLFAYHLRSAHNLDIAHETVTLPLYEGRTSAGQPTWYIVSDASTRSEARRLGVNYAHKLSYAADTKAVQQVHVVSGTVVFPGTVNFSRRRVLVPGPDGFPPARYAPGARGDSRYSPLIRLPNGTMLDAPQVANRTGRNGSVVAIDYRRRTVTLNLLAGWVDGQFTLYLHTDASSPLIAALEESNYAPNLNAAPGLGSDEPPSSRAAIIPVVNGPRGDSNPLRQGLQSSLLGQGDPLNVAQEQPSDPVHYTPIWDVSPVEWTAAAIRSGKRVQLQSQAQVGQEAMAGDIVSALPGTPDASIGGINASGAISNCPIVAVFPGP
jgi:hypothetical protein